MAENKQAMGHDPLAWLANEGELAIGEGPGNGTKNPTQKKSMVTQETTVKTDIDLVEDSFVELADKGEQIVSDFYQHLFLHYPELLPLFEGVSTTGQQKKLLAALLLVVKNLRKPEVLNDYLHGLGGRHQEYGVAAGDYNKLTTSLLAVLKEHAGDSWTEEVDTAWRHTLQTLTQIMLDAYESMDETEVAASSAKQEGDVTAMTSALDGAVTSIMMVDRDFTITYANKSMLDMLGEQEATLREVLPGFSVKSLVGSYIDSFLHIPGHQRQLLSNPDNLPHTTDIQAGPLTFRLDITAMFDNSGAYVGNMLEWHNLTEEKRRNGEIYGQFEALSKVMGMISLNMDGTIIDANDHFLDMVGYSRDEVLGQHHGMIVGPDMANSYPYAELWARLNRGATETGEFLCKTKSGRKIWLQASYSPVFDINGRPLKVVKFVTEITSRKQSQLGVDEVLSAAGVVMNAMAEGDLTKAMEGEYEGEFARLQQAVNDAVKNMSSLVQDMTEASVSMTSAANVVSQGNLDLGQHTQKQALSLKEAAGCMKALTSHELVQSVHGREVEQLARDTHEKAEKGGNVIQNAIEAMAAINESNKKVADTIGVIDEMAFQGNLLALNAAVEAARAGEQGRAFAVIASEVRNLAQRAAGAVNEIRQLINDSGDRVKQGTAMIDESGRTMEDIAKGTRKLGDIITEMAMDSIKQTRGVEQMNNAVTRVDEMTQQSLALVEQVATASETLDKQSRSLQKRMALFEAGQDIVSVPRRDNRFVGRSAAQPTDARQGMRPRDDDERNKV